MKYLQEFKLLSESAAHCSTVKQWLPDKVRHLLGVSVVISLVLVLFVFTSLTSVDIFFWVFFFSMFWWNINEWVSITLALSLLTILTIFMALHQYAGITSGEDWAEVVAVLLYFFLTICVMKQVWEMMRKKNETEGQLTDSIVKVPRYGGSKNQQVITKTTTDNTSSPLARPRKVDYVRKI